MKRLTILALLLAASAALPLRTAAQGEALAFEEAPGQVRLLFRGQTVARYVYRDPQILRPYWCDVKEPGGVQVTRAHPPVDGKDRTDHADMHPGLWLAFGDLNGSDFWRNKGRVVHDRFTSPPRGGRERAGFAAERSYLAPDGTPVARESCRYTIVVRPEGYLLLTDSRFEPAGDRLELGDQEEMGLGIRVATPLAVSGGGRILNSDALRNEKAVWGKTAAWCDSSGTIGGRRAGMTIFTDPASFRPSWFHARDYGLLVANPFGRKAFAQGEESRLVVTKAKPLRLRFGVLVHGSDGPEPDYTAAYQDFVKLLGKL